MPDTSPPLSRTIAWILLILFIALSAFYYWRETTLSRSLSAQSSQLKDTAQGLAAARETEKGLRAEMDSSRAAHQAEVQRLTGELEAARKASADLAADIESLKAQHAETLGAERDKASQAYSELEGRLTAANQQIDELGSKIGGLEQAMAQAEADYQSRAKQIEQELGERIAFYKTALSGSDPERAQQISDLEQRAQAAQGALLDEQQARQAAETEHQARLTEAGESIDELNSEIQDLQTQLTEAESALGGLQSQHEAALAEHAAAIAAAEGQIQDALDAHARTKAEASERTSTLESDLKATRASLEALRQEHETTIDGLNARISEGEQALAKLQADLAAAEEAEAAAARAHEQEITEARQQYALLDNTYNKEQTEAQALLKRTRDTYESEVRSLQARIAKAQHSLELLSDFRDKGGRLTDEGFMIDLANTELQFAGGQAELPAGDLPTLDLIAQALNEFPELRVRVDGHTDAAGDEEPNLELSRQRAAAVMQGLADRGVPAERMTSEGYGETRPIASNDTWDGRRQNRRVEIYILEP